MKQILLSILCSIGIILQSCSERDPIKHYSIACDQFISSEFTTLVDSVFFIPVRRSGSEFWGEINSIRFKDEFFVLHDETHSQSLVFIENNGNVRQFSKIGDGPDEYQQIFAFRVIDSSSFVIYDRNFGFKYYSYPAFNHLKSVDVRPDYYINITNIHNNGFLLVKEHNFGELESGGYYFTDEKMNLFTKTNIPDDFVSIDLSYPSTFNEIDDRLYFLQSNVINTLFTVSAESIQKEFTFDFGAHNVNEKDLWKSPDPYPFENEIYYNQKSAFPHYLINQPNHFLCWFKNGLDQGLDNLAIVDKVANKNVVIKKILHNGENVILDILPKGMKDDFYLTMLTEESEIDKSIASHYELNLDADTEYIMGYRINPTITKR